MFEIIETHFTYEINGEKKSCSLNNDIWNDDFKGRVSLIKENQYTKLKLSIEPFKEIKIHKLYITIPFIFNNNHRIYVNGY